MKAEGGVLPTNMSDLLPAMLGDPSYVKRSQSQIIGEEIDHVSNTAMLVSKLALHTAWDVGTPKSDSVFDQPS